MFHRRRSRIIRARWVHLDATSSTREGAQWTTISPTPFLPPSSWISIVAPPVFIKDHSVLAMMVVYSYRLLRPVHHAEHMTRALPSSLSANSFYLFDNDADVWETWEHDVQEQIALVYKEGNSPQHTDKS
ncbi:hypothetical protein FRC03_005385 [Tulasnella sp. 419]|nr:hypothetical protein FRC03_005385 [Tulasnella sp. 419]